MTFSTIHHANFEALKQPFAISQIAKRRGKFTPNLSLRRVLTMSPKVDLKANVTRIVPNQVVRLSWKVLFADRIKLTDSRGKTIRETSLDETSIEYDSKISISPRENTTYTMVVYGPGGSASDSVSITVKRAQPSKPKTPKRKQLFPMLTLRRQRVGNVFTFTTNLTKIELLGIVGIGPNLDEINKISRVKNPNNYAISVGHIDERGTLKETIINAFGTTSVFNQRRIFGTWIANTNSLFTSTGQQRTTIPISITIES